MRIIAFLVAFLLLTAPAFGQSDFRGFEWGTPEAEIIQEEGRPLRTLQREGLDWMLYSVEINYKNAICLYILTPSGNELGGAAYMFSPDHGEDVEEYYSDFQEIADRLRKEYGKPDSTSMYWKNDRFKDRPGRAIALGYLLPEHRWENRDGIIVHYMNIEERFDVQHIVQYVSKEHQEEVADELLERDGSDGSPF